MQTEGKLCSAPDAPRKSISLGVQNLLSRISYEPSAGSGIFDDNSVYDEREEFGSVLDHMQGYDMSHV